MISDIKFNKFYFLVNILRSAIAIFDNAQTGAIGGDRRIEAIGVVNKLIYLR